MRHTRLHDGYYTGFIRNGAACIYTLSAALYYLMRFQLRFMDMVPNTAPRSNPHQMVAELPLCVLCRDDVLQFHAFKCWMPLKASEISSVDDFFYPDRKSVV